MDFASRNSVCGDSTKKTMSKLDTALSALKAVVNGMPDEVIDTHIRNILNRCEEAIKEIEDNE